ncbi:MAG: hypothetical protein HC880_09275, partial [Bacteroidia bacterium]|nr:hypothetical protein [Bacteroidia bacterium]
IWGLLSSPPVPSVLYLLGFSQYQTRNYQDASENLKVVASQNNKQGQYAAYYLGLSYLALENLVFAANALEEAKTFALKS